LKDNDIFILQFPKVNDLSFSFSYGKILSLKDNEIKHTASTDIGSSGSTIIRRSKENYIIGLHYGGYENNKNEYKFNLATSFDFILDNIKQQNNEINCIYIPNKHETEINLLHDYNFDVNKWNEKNKNDYLKVKNINKKIFEENIEIYTNDKKIKFDFKYKIKDSNSKKIKVKFKFKKLLTNTSFMFRDCSSLESIDLTSFNTTNVKDMSFMFDGCSSLKSIDLSSINTTNVNNTSFMFCGCSSLKSIDLFSFTTNNVNDMSFMFGGCSSLKSIDLSSFDTTNVNNMSLMFYNCSSLKSIDLTSFNINNVNDISFMFDGCSSLKKENIKMKNKNDKILDEIKFNLK